MRAGALIFLSALVVVVVARAHALEVVDGVAGWNLQWGSGWNGSAKVSVAFSFWALFAKKTFQNLFEFHFYQSMIIAIRWNSDHQKQAGCGIFVCL